MTVAAIATLLGGILLGYAGQRSRMCFVGAFRDFVLVRDTYRLKGFVAFALTAWLLHPVVGLVLGDQAAGLGASNIVGSIVASSIVLAVVGALGLGVFSTLANGCPFRQHVLAGQGASSSLGYLAGFYAGALVFHLAIAPWLGRFL